MNTKRLQDAHTKRREETIGALRVKQDNLAVILQAASKSSSEGECNNPALPLQ